MSRLPLLPLPLSLSLFVLLSACADFPDLDTAIAQRGQIDGFPTLIPIDPILLAISGDSQDAERQVAALNARVSQLHARALALRRPVIDPPTRRRMAAAVRRNNP